MTITSTKCGLCGKTFNFNTSFFAPSPDSAGFFIGNICPECSDRRQLKVLQQAEEVERANTAARWNTEQTIQVELVNKAQKQLELNRRQFEISQQQELENQIRREQFEVELERGRLNALVQIEERKRNPGEYECIACRFVTLKYRSTKCTSCQASIPSEYWEEVDERRAKRVEVERAEERLRIESKRKDDENRKALRLQVQQIKRENIAFHVFKGAGWGFGIGCILAIPGYYIFFALVGLWAWNQGRGVSAGNMAAISVIALTTVLGA